MDFRKSQRGRGKLEKSRKNFAQVAQWFWKLIKGKLEKSQKISIFMPQKSRFISGK